MIPAVVAEQIRASVLDYLQTTFNLSDPEVEGALFDFLTGPDGLFKGPYVDLRLPFRRAESTAESPLGFNPPFAPYQHQLEAFRRLHSREEHAPKATLVTTGTGSGKTECFLYPILDHCLRVNAEHRDESGGVKAIILYPMNALATDQARRIAGLLWNNAELREGVSAGLYVGGKGTHGTLTADYLVDQRDVLRQSPPDVLLTNYRMLDFLLIRPEDQPLWRHNSPDTLRYLVLDELHTYDGAQGSDVGCLIRRLRARLGAKQDTICPVGTSATVGEGVNTDSVALLTQFATDVFGVKFGNESVVTEQRLSVDEAFPRPEHELETILSELAEEKLDPESCENVGDYIRGLCKAWLDHDEPSPVELGRQLSRHRFLRSLLLALRGQIRHLGELDERLLSIDGEYAELTQSLRHSVLRSFLSLVSHARKQAGDQEEPLLQCQIQLWVRELRRLVRKVNKDPEFAWYEYVSRDQDAKWLPIVHCRECGGMGWGAIQQEETRQLSGNPASVGEAYLRSHRTARYAVPGISEGMLVPDHWLCPSCLRLNQDTECICATQEPGLPTRLSIELTDGRIRRFRERCPECGSDRALSMLGSRAASLSSVAITQLYLSPFNRDRKLLAFTNSVQDASHLAGFYSSRTYRFNVRTAMQAVLEATNDDVSLADLPSQMIEHWQAKVDSPAAFVATFLPPDLRALEEYEVFVKNRGKTEQLVHLLNDRLSWEVVQEYGYRTLVGRTLERTGCSTAFPDEKRMEEVANKLTADIAEKRIVARQVTTEQVRRFLDEVVYRLRTRGGVFHRFVDAYARQGGRWYLLTKRFNPLMSPIPGETALPRFWYSGDKHSVFDTYLSKGKSEGWYTDWASRCLGVETRDQGINDLYRTTVRRLVEAEVLEELPCGKGKVHGLSPQSLVVTKEVARVSCPNCGRESTLPRHVAERAVGGRCGRYRCPGTLEPRGRRRDSYYRRVYRSGRVKRIFAAEHTGLLERQVREGIEERFKAGAETDPEAPNLLTCTPTLEMGIDIGDLSATLLCAVPPMTANYLQRVGRAGRKTGNALGLVLANSRPHDLYFYGAPLEMMAGEVSPPGLFLDAPEMLRRQLVAFAMDAWAKQETELKVVPAKAMFVLSEGGRKEFPGRFIEFYKVGSSGIVENFIALFGDALGDESQERLRLYGEPGNLTGHVAGAFDLLQQELGQLRNTDKRLVRRIQDLEAHPTPDSEQDKTELNDARRVIRRLIGDLQKKYPLNVLTDAGVLPNYAFPEPGVKLKSVIKGSSSDTNEEPKPPKGKVEKRNYHTFEYQRAASVALREFAPFNTFYAEGRRLEVGQIDIGSTARPLTEKWRFCAVCHHAVRSNADGFEDDACPRCDDHTWCDSGQVRTVVAFRQAQSYSEQITAITADDSDERDQRSYFTQELIDVGPKQWAGARVVEQLPFGFELLQDLRIRELNLGPQPGHGLKLRIAGRSFPEDGFVVCKDCGAVKRPTAKGDAEIHHAAYCGYRHGKKAEKTEAVFLYREIISEAIRVLLPVSTMEVTRSLASFKAALQLGFRKRFRGNPGHLVVTTVQEPVREGGNRCFLVIYDGVPGGTGYLADLWHNDGLIDVLRLALEAARSCSCRNDPTKDGCYRCVYAYQSQRELANISRKHAVRLLSEIVAQAGGLTDTKTLSSVNIDSLLESELERKFIAAICTHAEKTERWSWEPHMHRGKDCWKLVADGVPWRIEPQVKLGWSDGVAVTCRPDFIIEPLRTGGDVLPVAVFCDGLRYHACPDKKQGRIYDDVDKRQAIIDSSRYCVWSVTWKDVEAFERRQTGAPSIFAGLESRAAKAAYMKPALTEPVDLHERNSVDTLLAYLETPVHEQWTQLARRLALVLLTKPCGWAVQAVDQVEQQLREAASRFNPGDQPIASSVVRAWCQSGSWWAGLIRCPEAAFPELLSGGGSGTDLRVTLRLFDEREGREDEDFEQSWRTLLHAWNLLQFHEHIEVLTSEQIQLIPDPGQRAGRSRRRVSNVPPPTVSSDPKQTRRVELAELFDLVDESCIPAVEVCRDHSLPLPVAGLDIEANGRVVCTVELGWPDLKAAVVMIGEEQVQAQCEKLGWKVAIAPKEPAEWQGVLEGLELSK